MIDDKKRQEVAQELRKQAAYCDGSLSEWWQRLQDTVTGVIDFADPKATFEAIADLIDPQTTPYICENVYDENECGACRNGFKCSVCGVTVEDCEGYYVHGTWNYCPKCRRKVVKGGH